MHRGVNVKTAASIYRYLSLAALLAVLIQPLSALTTSAQTPPPVGSLRIYLTDDAGAAPGGACYSVTDVNGNTIGICDDDGDGLATLSSIPAGAVTVVQTSAPAGHNAAAAGYGTVLENDTASVYMISTVIPVQITQEEPPPADDT